MSPWLVCRVAVCCATLRHLSVVIIIVKIVWALSGSPSCQTDQEWRYGGQMLRWGA